MTNHVSLLDNLSLLASTREVVVRSNHLTAVLLLHLSEVESRGLYRDQAFPSMFAYCVGELGFSEDVAYNVTTVARLVQQFPALLAGLREGRLHLSGLRLLAPHFKKENSEDLIARAWGKTKREIEGIVAHIAPQPEVPDTIRKLPSPRAPEAPAPEAPPLDLFSLPAPASLVAPVALPAPAPELPVAQVPVSVPPLATPPMRRDQVKPLAPNAYKIEFTASDALQEKLKEAQALLRHRRPDGSLAFIVEQALDLLIAKVKKQRFGIGAKPRSAPAPKADAGTQPSATRHVPYSARRSLADRDGLRCTHVGPDGRRCSEMAFLELEHRKGFARTGEHSVEDMTYLCKAHNDLAAERLYGRAFMKRKRGAAHPGTAESPAPILRSSVAESSRPGTAGSPAPSLRSSESNASRPGTAESPAPSLRSSVAEASRPGTAESQAPSPRSSVAEASRPGESPARSPRSSESNASRPGTAARLRPSELRLRAFNPGRSG